MVTLLTPADGAVVSTKTKWQKLFAEKYETYAAHPNWREAIGGAPDYCGIAEPVRFSWESDDSSRAFELSETPDFTSVIRWAEDCTEYDVYNLELGRTYYWRVGDSEIRSFTMELDLPRIMYADGVWNIRDIGGYRTVDGKSVRQGLIFRGSELTLMEPRGIARMRDEIGIRFELDLRAHDEEYYAESPLGSDIGYVRISTKIGGSFVLNFSDVVKEIRILTDPKNYPIYIHCAAGADRTGSLLATIEGILGFEQEDAIFDYEWTTLSGPGSERCRVGDYTDYLAAVEPFGQTFGERVCNWLISLGMTQEELQKIRDIMLEV